MVNKMTISQIAALTNFDKSYISKVITGEKPASVKFLESLSKLLPEIHEPDYLKLFLQSRQAMGVSPKTLCYYQERLSKFIRNVNYLRATSAVVQKYLNTVPANANGLATRHASYRTIKTFYRWLKSEYGLNNPVEGIQAPILGKPMMPTLDETQVKQLIESVDCVRDKAIIALFVESGLRLSELANIQPDDINWPGRCIKVLGKGRKVAHAPFGDLSNQYLIKWLAEYKPDGNVWGLNAWGITSMLRRLEAQTGITCNPHTFRRTFAVLLRKAGIDTMTIKELGRWESLEMVQRYTRSFSFQDSMKFYRSTLT
ncbi:MAG: tyrosine-type recombinase/integrase [Dehalococcoidia bacterium]|jgi:site-specific recombinase XerD